MRPESGSYLSKKQKKNPPEHYSVTFGISLWCLPIKIIAS